MRTINNTHLLLKASSLISVIGRPCIGKTTLIEHVIAHTGKMCPRPLLTFSLGSIFREQYFAKGLYTEILEKGGLLPAEAQMKAIEYWVDIHYRLLSSRPIVICDGLPLGEVGMQVFSSLNIHVSGMLHITESSPMDDVLIRRSVERNRSDYRYSATRLHTWREFINQTLEFSRFNDVVLEYREIDAYQYLHSTHTHFLSDAAHILDQYIQKAL